ncbi:phosphonate C-P lyase system protein PhnK [Desulfonatronum thioautotrophicum]|uniref:phosphonate C-P lyase system protein PhnK n=1 Tax=Desulfonatronum thioautotrophicum TaxID=617001 RepID=UPI000B08570E|nr:phosphonate C-P lyase system protein PhnK [Desulfonatronum thioautotrophicum]
MSQFLNREAPCPDVAEESDPGDGMERETAPSGPCSPGMEDNPLLIVEDVGKSFNGTPACRDISFMLWPGEVLAIVGESGSGKTTLLRCLSAGIPADTGRTTYSSPRCGEVEVFTSPEHVLRRLHRTEWGLVHQNPRDGLRLGVSAGANIGERLMSLGQRNYAAIRDEALTWLNKVEIKPDRIDDLPLHFSGGMQQRLQIARNLVTRPRLMFMDEPTGGLDVSVQARLLDLLRSLCSELHLAVILVTHDLGVARLLADRLLVMQCGRVVESGLTDQVLDDPHHPYTQLLVASILEA